MAETPTMILGWVARLTRFRPRLGWRRSTYALRVPAGGDALRSTPVSLLTVAGGRYAIAAAAGADWLADARAAGWGFLARGRCDERVTLVESSPAERWSVLAAPGWRAIARWRPPAGPAAAPAASPFVYRIDGPDTCP